MSDLGSNEGTMSDESTYIHGTDPEEQERLALMNEIINRASVAELGVRGGARILELASGLGHMARAMARAAGPRGEVIAIERSSEQIASARRLAEAAGEEGLHETRQGDALHPPLEEREWGTFDLVHARFLLEHVADPLGIVEVMVRAARPGGRIVIEDDNHDTLRLWPEPAGFAELWQAYMDGFRKIGCDPVIGTKLVSLLLEAGARPVRTAIIPYTACAGSPLFDGVVRNLIEVIRGTRRTIVDGGLMAGDAFDAAIASLKEWSALPDAACWYYLCWAEGSRPSR
jgi:ubiquinone/menaquinone biosynthesis C-methylase UbiE